MRNRAVIGSSIVINGTVTGDEDLLIEGTVEGTIDLSAHQVSVGESGRVNADVTARIVRIDGQVSGDVVGKEKVIISQTGDVRGNVIAPRVTLEDGAMFKGSIDMTAGEKSAPQPVQAATAGGAQSGGGASGGAPSGGAQSGGAQSGGNKAQASGKQGNAAARQQDKSPQLDLKNG